MSILRWMWLATGVLAFLLNVDRAVASSQERFALLIANETYVGAAAPSSGTPADETLLADSLRKNKFDVSVLSNLDGDGMRKALGEFTRRLTPDSVGLIYFKGYGIQVARQTFLIPINAPIYFESDVRRNGISIDAILAGFDGVRAKIKVAILDAALHDPLERRFRAFSAGLASAALPDNTLTIFVSPSDAENASVKGSGSLFTRELVKRLDTPGLSAEDAMSQTKNAVAELTNGQEVPLVSSSLKDPFKFAQAAATAGEYAPRADKIVKDCEICPDLVVLPSGKFSMGSNDSPYTRPIHRVSIEHPFAVARTPVTFEDWSRCVASGGCTYQPNDEGWGGAERPVINVSWDDAKQYLAWLSQKAGHPYRLPSEAEWEYAARGGTQTRFFWGATVGRQKANCKDCDSSPARQTMPVQSYGANPFGLFDMGGNVAQWVSDCWNDRYRNAPRDGSPWLTGDCSQRVLRGGSFLSAASEIEPSARFRYDSTVRYYANGLRVARDVP